LYYKLKIKESDESRKIGKAKAYQSNDRCLEAAAAFGTIRKT
jgi:hypothetical protein